jgi:hypothetical protein
MPPGLCYCKFFQLLCFPALTFRSVGRIKSIPPPHARSDTRAASIIIFMLDIFHVIGSLMIYSLSKKPSTISIGQSCAAIPIVFPETQAPVFKQRIETASTCHYCIGDFFLCLRPGKPDEKRSVSYLSEQSLSNDGSLAAQEFRHLPAAVGPDACLHHRKRFYHGNRERYRRASAYSYAVGIDA